VVQIHRGDLELLSVLDLRERIRQGQPTPHGPRGSSGLPGACGGRPRGLECGTPAGSGHESSGSRPSQPNSRALGARPAAALAIPCSGCGGG